MTYTGVVKNGKIELEPPAELPEGMRVRVEPEASDWMELAKRLADEITRSLPPGSSLVEEVLKSRK